MRFAILHEEHRELIEDFLCDDEPTVALFLKEEALKLQMMNVVRTRLYFDDANHLIGYFSLFNDTVEMASSKRKQQGWALPRNKHIPAIRLHYFGVDQRYRKNGYGEYLLAEVLMLCQDVAQVSGCKFITLESLPSSVDFYSKYDFIKIARRNDYQIMVYLLE